jgi:hypothetical protein
MEYQNTPKCAAAQQKTAAAAEKSAPRQPSLTKNFC